METPNFAIPKIERAEVHATRPEAADLRKIHHFRLTRGSDLPEVTFLYKVYLRDRPEPSGRALELFLGDYQVRKYNEFSGGLFFTVNDLKLAERLAGAPIRFRIEGTEALIDSGVSVPPFETMGDTLKAVAGGSSRGAALPSQQDLLRK